MSIYEITFITREDKSEEVEELIKKLTGKILNKKSIGRKKFTYPIKKDSAGFYLIIIFELEPSKLNEFDKTLRINQNIIRHLIISYQKEFTPKEIQEKLDELKNIKPKIEEKDEKELAPKKEETKKTEKTFIESKTKEIVDQKKDDLVKEEKIKESKTEKKELLSEKTTEIKTEKPKIEIPKPKKEAFSEEERLAKLEEKLDELLKD